MSMLFLQVIFSILFTGCWSRCENGWLRYEDSCFWIGYNQTLTFNASEKLCRQHNGHLIHLNSAAENRFIIDYLHLTKASNCWIGLSDMDVEGKWEWYGTGKAPEFTYWFHGQPSTGTTGEGEDCAMYKAAHPDYNWDDYLCTNHFHPICETSDVLADDQPNQCSWILYQYFPCSPK